MSYYIGLLLLTQQFLILKIIVLEFIILLEASYKRKNKESFNQKYISVSVFTWSCVDTAQAKSNRPRFEESINATDIKSINRANIEHVH